MLLEPQLLYLLLFIALFTTGLVYQAVLYSVECWTSNQNDNLLSNVCVLPHMAVVFGVVCVMIIQLAASLIAISFLFSSTLVVVCFSSRCITRSTHPSCRIVVNPEPDHYCFISCFGCTHILSTAWWMNIDKVPYGKHGSVYFLTSELKQDRTLRCGEAYWRAFHHCLFTFFP